MKQRFWVVRAALAVGLVTMAIGLVACGSDDGGDAKGSAAAPSKGTVDPSGAVMVVAKDNSYTPNEISGPAGQPITVTLDNQGAAIHNVVLKDQKGTDGQEIQTALINAKQTGTVAFTLPAGSYDFYCSVHPVEMRGKLTLQ